MLNSLRRLVAAALVIAVVACVVEVLLRWRLAEFDDDADPKDLAGIPVLPSRVTRLELPAAWRGEVRHAESGIPIEIRINSFGLRGDEPAIPKPPGMLRIVCLGDEFTLAAGLRESEAYPAQLAERLRGATSSSIEVINAGLPGGCPLTETVLYRRDLMAFDADIVILHLDVTDALEDAELRSTLRLDAQGRPIAVVHRTFEVHEGALAPWEGRFAIADYLCGRIRQELTVTRQRSNFEEFQRRMRAWRDSPLENGRDLPPAVRSLVHLQELVATGSGRLVLSTCPDAWQAAEWLRQDVPDSEERAQLQLPSIALQRAAKQLGVPLLDLTPDVLRDPDPAGLYLPDSHGLSVRGHGLYAEALARLLTGLPATAAEESWRRQ